MYQLINKGDVITKGSFTHCWNLLMLMHSSPKHNITVTELVARGICIQPA